MMEPYEELECRFGEWIGNPNTVACSSSTAALHLSLEALNLPPGSKVVIPEFTMIACARAVTLAGLVPVFVDCGDDLLMRPDLLSKAPSHTSAVMAVHIYGRQCNMDAVHRVATDRGWAVIEDMAELHGISPHPETDAAAWSFYQNKVIHGEEGGIVAFRGAAPAGRARKLRCMGFTAAHDYSHSPRGHNYRLANLLARPILRSLADVDANLAARRHVEAWYDELMPEAWQLPKRLSPWVYDLRIPGLTVERQNAIVQSLLAVGVAARHGFKPMSGQQEYRSPHRHLLADVLAREVIYLPLTPETQYGDVQKTVAALVQAVEAAKG